MKIPYCPTIWIDQTTGSLDYVLRPEIELIVHGPTESVIYSALVDTGSDDVVLPSSLGRYVGASLTPSPRHAQAFGGSILEFAVGEVELELKADGDSFRWRTEVKFMEFSEVADETLVVGHKGFLEFFTAIFDGHEAVLTLTPNADLPITRSVE